MVQISTGEYKIKPLNAAARELLGYPHPTRVPRGVFAEQAVDISVDGVRRAKDSDARYLRNVFPLLDLGMTREDCVRCLSGRGCTSRPTSVGPGTRWTPTGGPWMTASLSVSRSALHPRQPVRTSSQPGLATCTSAPIRAAGGQGALDPQRTRVGSDPAGVRARDTTQPADGDLRLRRRAAP